MRKGHWIFAAAACSALAGCFEVGTVPDSRPVASSAVEAAPTPLPQAPANMQCDEFGICRPTG